MLSREREAAFRVVRAGRLFRRIPRAQACSGEWLWGFAEPAANCRAALSWWSFRFPSSWLVRGWRRSHARRIGGEPRDGGTRRGLAIPVSSPNGLERSCGAPMHGRSLAELSDLQRGGSFASGLSEPPRRVGPSRPDAQDRGRFRPPLPGESGRRRADLRPEARRYHPMRACVAPESRCFASICGCVDPK